MSTLTDIDLPGPAADTAEDSAYTQVVQELARLALRIHRAWSPGHVVCLNCLHTSTVAQWHDERRCPQCSYHTGYGQNAQAHS